MKIIVTGATGFIGSHFTKHALNSDCSVVALRRSPSSVPRIQLDQQPQWLDRALDQVTAEDLKGSDVLVHLATHTGNIPYDSLTNCLRWNLIAVLELFEKARSAGIRHYIVAGSCFEYGRSGERYLAIPTDAPLEPTNSYSVSKAAASIALRQWAEEHQQSLSILRPFHVFGEGEPEGRLWPSLRRQALAGFDFPMTAGEQIRDFISVEDAARIFFSNVLWLYHQPVGTMCIKNIGTGNPQTIREFSEYWWKSWKASGRLLIGSIPYRNGEVMRYVPKV
jgi:nucleoside-diphosphate-sugar epimerase